MHLHKEERDAAFDLLDTLSACLLPFLTHLLTLTLSLSPSLPPPLPPQKEERDAAFDLLDALSRSGALDINCAELHVVVAATHCFARTVVDTVIMDNVNPIEKVERSVLIVGTTIHNQPDARALLQPQHAQRVLGHSPQLFLEDANTTAERKQDDE